MICYISCSSSVLKSLQSVTLKVYLMLKVYLFSFLLALFASGNVEAQNSFNVSLKFSKSEFSFVTNSNGSLIIKSDKYTFGYASDVNEPGLPLVPINVRVPNGGVYDSFSVTQSKTKIFDGVNVAANPTPVPTNVIDTIPIKQVKYANSCYPKENVQFIEESNFDGYSVVRFLVCPFEFDNQSKSLYLNDSICLNIKLKDIADYSQYSIGGGENMAELVNSITVNPIETNASIIPITPDLTVEGKLDYVIVTSSDLVDSFKPLALWKKQKGVKSAITSIEEIVKKYPARDVQLSIKSYLYDMYRTNRIKYVLLGGDDTVVPVRGCYVSVDEAHTQKLMPTDLYYACFGKDLTWDANNNGIYGEIVDNINMNPSIYVSRVPVRTTEDVKNFVNKLLGYEKDPAVNGWNNNILMAGVKLFGASQTEYSQSDSKVKGDKLYSNYIGKYWNGKRLRFYDTFNDLDRGANYTPNNTNLGNEFQKGYTFIDMIAHGSPIGWGNSAGYVYMAEDVDKIVNDQYSIITTNACLTNAFDSFKDEYGIEYEPCLSETFLRNKKSGIIAYLGCSREGWGVKNDDLGTSLKYESLYYKNLFASNIKEKNFGKIVTLAKQELLNFCKCDGTYRWVQFGLNPIGDPEMPVYTATPSTLKGANTLYVKNIKGISVSVPFNIDSCTICVSSLDDNGESYYKVAKNVRIANFADINKDVLICITKQNYIPIMMNCSAYKDLGLNISNSNDSGALYVNVEVEENASKNSLVVSTINGDKEYQIDIPKGQNSMTIDKSILKEGINIFSLYSDGKLLDSKNVIK